MAIEGIRPVGHNNHNTQQKKQKGKQYSRTIGGVTFTGDAPIKDEDIKVKQSFGQKTYSVFLSDNRKIVFTENSNNNAKVQYSGDGKHPDTNPDIMYFENMKNAEIYGSPNSQDFIYMNGESYANSIIVDNDYPSLTKPRYHRQDHVCLSADTFSNDVKAGRADYIDIHWYDERQPDLDGEYIEIHKKHETIDQNEVLQDTIGNELYRKHFILSFKNRKSQN